MFRQIICETQALNESSRAATSGTTFEFGDSRSKVVMVSFGRIILLYLCLITGSSRHVSIPRIIRDARFCAGWFVARCCGDGRGISKCFWFRKEPERRAVYTVSGRKTKQDGWIQPGTIWIKRCDRPPLTLFFLQEKSTTDLVFVGFGPSSKTWPKCAPQDEQTAAEREKDLTVYMYVTTNAGNQ